MSAIGPKRTSLVAPHMSAFGDKADMNFFRKSGFAVAIGDKADMACCSDMSANDSKRTWRFKSPWESQGTSSATRKTRWTKVQLGDRNGPRDFIPPALNYPPSKGSRTGRPRVETLADFGPWSLVSESPIGSKKPRNGGNICIRKSENLFSLLRL